MDEKKYKPSSFPFWGMGAGVALSLIDCPEDGQCLTHILGGTVIAIGGLTAIADNYETIRDSVKKSTEIMVNAVDKTYEITMNSINGIGHFIDAHKYDLTRKLTGKKSLCPHSLEFSYMHS